MSREGNDWTERKAEIESKIRANKSMISYLQMRVGSWDPASPWRHEMQGDIKRMQRENEELELELLNLERGN